MPRLIPTLRWKDQPIDFIEALVEKDISAFYIQLAIETLLGSTLLDEVTTAFVMDNQVYRVHRTPPSLSFPELYVTVTVSEDGQEVTIEDICFCHEALQ